MAPDGILSSAATIVAVQTSGAAVDRSPPECSAGSINSTTKTLIVSRRIADDAVYTMTP